MSNANYVNNTLDLYDDRRQLSKQNELKLRISSLRMFAVVVT